MDSQPSKYKCTSGFDGIIHTALKKAKSFNAFLSIVHSIVSKWS